MNNGIDRHLEVQGKITDGIIIVFPFVHVCVTYIGHNVSLIDATWWYRNRKCSFTRRVELDMLDSVLDSDVATDMIVEEFIMNISKQMVKIEKEDFERYRDGKDVEIFDILHEMEEHDNRHGMSNAAQSIIDKYEKEEN